MRTIAVAIVSTSGARTYQHACATTSARPARARRGRFTRPPQCARPRGAGLVTFTGTSPLYVSCNPDRLGIFLLSHDTRSKASDMTRKYHFLRCQYGKGCAACCWHQGSGRVQVLSTGKTINGIMQRLERPEADAKTWQCQNRSAGARRQKCRAGRFFNRLHQVSKLAVAIELSLLRSGRC